MNLTGKTYFVTGGSGFLGRVLVRKLRERGANVFAPPRRWCDLLDEYQVTQAFDNISTDIDAVFHLAANVGGIGVTQSQPGKAFYDNMLMGLNVIDVARQFAVKRVVVAGSVCAYPLHTPVPMTERNLWIGEPEPTNGPYGVAKRALSTMLDAYRQQYQMDGAYLLMANMYGPGDNFNPATSHVIPALIRKFSDARLTGSPSVTVWGSGRPSRDFLYVEDAADAFILAALAPADKITEPINIGSGVETPIYALAEMIRQATDYHGETVYDTSKPDGQPRRRLSTWRAEEVLGWKATTALADGIQATVKWWEGRP